MGGAGEESNGENGVGGGAAGRVVVGGLKERTEQWERGAARRGGKGRRGVREVRVDEGRGGGG